MKLYNIIVTISFLILSNSIIFSQTALNKANYSLSGSISYSYSKNTENNELSDYESKIDNFSFSPNFGLFIINNLLVGGNISFRYNEFNNKSTYRNFLGNPITLEAKNILRQLSFGPTIRYYFSGFKIFPFVEVAYNYSSVLASDQYGHIFNFTGGINYFISTSVALEPFIGYSLSTYKNPDEDVNAFSVGIRVNYFVIKNE
ncbi:MAG: autotransporter outer membrane beta-barrel domain-containing protein [Ignavibacteriaceae bacterium]